MKKILILILSFVMVVSLGTAYAEQQAEVLPNSPDMVFATSLGILDEYLDQTSALTRIELASVFYNIMMSGVEPAMNNSKFFSDVGFENAPYADFAYQCGIMTGAGDGKFEPDSQVTYSQAIKTIVAFLGYSEHAAAQGGYPYGYLALAQRLDLIDTMPPSIDSVITISKLASMLRLATNVPLMQRVTFGSEDIKFEVNKGSDYLSTYMDITRIRGRVTANYLVDLEGSDALSYGQVKIENKLFSITEASNDIVSCLGYETDIYVKGYKESKVPSIIYYELNDTNKTIVIDGENVKGISSGRIEYYDAEKDKYAKIANSTKVIYNGSLVPSYDNDDIDPFENSNLEGEVRLIDNSSDGIYDVIIVDAYGSYIVKNIVDNMIFNEFVPSEVVDLGSDFEDGDIEITNILGQPIKLSEIEEGDIINVSKDKNNNVKRIVVTVDTYTGIIRGIDTSRGIVDVDGFEFEMSKTLSRNSSFKPGTKVTLYFNKSSKVSDIRESSQKYRIGYLVALRESAGLDSEYIFKIFTSSGVFEELKLASKVQLVCTNQTKNAADAYADFLPQNTGSNHQSIYYNRQPILYTVNDDGDINQIDWCANNDTTPRNGLYMMEAFDGKEQKPFDGREWKIIDGSSEKNITYRAAQLNFESKLIISASTVIFNVPTDVDDYENYYVETTSYYKDGTQNSARPFNPAAYSFDEKGSPCAAIIVELDGNKMDIPDSNDLFVVDEITSVLNSDGEDCYKISGWDYTSGARSIIVEKSVVNNAYGDISNLPARGDIMRCYEVGGVINAVEKIFEFDFANKQFNPLVNPSVAAFTSEFRCVCGEVIYNDGSYIKIAVDGTDDIQAIPISSARIVEVDFADDKEGVLTASNKNCIYASDSYPSHSSKVVIRTNRGSVRTIVVYNGLGGAN